MKNIKYVIIFSLLLALGIVYNQLNNYKNITNKLLLQSNTQTNTIKILENNITQQSVIITNLQKNLNSFEDTLLDEADQTELYKKIITLEEHIVSLEENQLNNEIEDINKTTQIEQLNERTDKPNNIKNDSLNITPNITLDEENKVTGFGLEYKEEF
ncbi:MAG: hypothetical protein U9R16_03390 [Campylobacterota bacterium]|nr:hypothetical protein [Campylobacterota bacterium]